MSVKKRGGSRLNAVLFAMLMEELTAGPSTWQELADHTGLSRNTIWSFIRALRARGLVHIACWEPDPRGALKRAAFSFGKKPDAPRPKLTKTQISQRYRARRTGGALLASAFSGMSAGLGA
jgi:DNA-binding IclR family transcriptional regulator